jgi:hypothetical protein
MDLVLHNTLAKKEKNVKYKYARQKTRKIKTVEMARSKWGTVNVHDLMGTEIICIWALPLDFEITVLYL